MEADTKPMPQDSTTKRSPFDNLSRDELIIKCKGLLTIAQKAKQAKTELQSEIESYKIQLGKIETEKKLSLDNLQTLQELVDSLTEQKLNYITEVDNAQGKIKALSSKCKDYEVEINKYKADLIIKDQSLTDNTQKLSDLDSEIISLKRQNGRLLEENEQLITQLSELETQTEQFKNIGLEQRKQLEMLEDRVQTDEASKAQIENLTKKIEELENQLQSNLHNNEDFDVAKFENKVKELTNLYESEKSKNEKANIKLRSYKDKILKCAACINQLKNSRFILMKTIKDYSENIPKWQNDIIKASKMLENEINQLNNENMSLKAKLHNLELQLSNITEVQNINEKETDEQNHLFHTENETLKEKVNELQNLLQSETENSEMYQTQILSLKNNCELLQSQLIEIQEQVSSYDIENTTLRQDLECITAKYNDLNEKLPTQVEINQQLTININEVKTKYNTLKEKNNELANAIDKLKLDNDSLTKSIQTNSSNNDLLENLNFQIKALESEKATLVKEKLNARDNVIDLENRNKSLLDQNNKLKTEILTIKSQLDTITIEKNVIEKRLMAEKENELSSLKREMKALQEEYDSLKKMHENMQDLNGLLREEVETLKLSLEQPRPDDCENTSDLNVSLQADIVKLETKLSAYKQENASLLAEIKESRSKTKEYDNITAEYEDAKSKLMGYKTENTELLNEMKEINQVLKERGEAISKLQKAIAEMERLVETLEKDRDNINEEKANLQSKVTELENDLKNTKENSNHKHQDFEQISLEKEAALKALSEKDVIINSLKDEIEKLKQQQPSSDLPNEDMSTSTISKTEEQSRMKDLDDSFEEKYTKLRIFALKLKKKLNDTIIQLQNAEQDKAKLEKLLNQNEKVQIPESKDETDNASVLNLQTKLTESVAASEKIEAEVQKLKAELEAKSQQLTAEIDAHKITKENLEKARRDAKKKNVLSLEMEDYERSMKELTTKMEEKKRKMVQMESIIDTQEGTITAMKTQIKLLEEQIRSEETQNRLTKEELQNIIEESREKDSTIQIKNEVISKLEQDFEDEKRKNEEAIFEITRVLSEKETLIITLGQEKIELNNKLKKLEYKCAELSENLKITNIELADLKTEYTSYKVRAQAVLRQNQTVDHSQEERLKEEAAALRTQIATLTAKLATVQ
ncbi:unnamed protein product [Diatraea saccharalis]|uniref:Uncharacterized protein n=1 Tax=Diatraea saccharalis TaxID=40085 RepID=A0A9P0C7G6_9NEOP|nr:unnamed protein product [Diatraea saccharalis]